MKTLYITVSNKIATYQKRCGDIVCGNTNYKIHFTFDSEWDNFTEKTARFIWGSKHFDVNFTGDTCVIPLIQNAHEVHVGVYAGQLATTTPATIGCRLSILCGDTTIDPSTATFEQGRKSQYDEFWDAYMPDEYMDCDSLFAGRGWNDITFKPPYDIPRGDYAPTSFSRMFANTNITNLSNVKIKWDKTTRTDMMFYWATRITELPEIDVSNVTGCNDMFSSATNLVTIEKFKVSSTTQLRDAFVNCNALENIVVEGELAYNGISFAQSTKLSKESITSIIEALSDSKTGGTLTLSLTAVDDAFRAHSGKEGSDTSEWIDLSNSKGNWNISLV